MDCSAYRPPRERRELHSPSVDSGGSVKIAQQLCVCLCVCVCVCVCVCPVYIPHLRWYRRLRGLPSHQAW